MKRVRSCIPIGPGDYIAPPMRHGLTQAGYGGPYVIRGNPIGAFFDQVRDFCSPVPMDQGSDTTIDDTSGMGLGTPGSASYEPSFGGQGFAAPISLGGTPVSDPGCAFGTHWNAAVGICQMDPEPMEPPDPCGQDNLIAARTSLRNAISRCDRAGVQTVLDGARSCRDSATAMQRPGWSNLVNEAKQAQSRMRTCKPMAQMMPGHPLAPPPSPNGPGKRFGPAERMPQAPDTRTMTEGNPDMMPHPDPMMGMIDADRAIMQPQMAAARQAPARPVRKRMPFGYMR